MITKRIAGFILIGALLAHTGYSQTSYKPGDRVEAEKDGKWHKATVLNETSGAYDIEFDDLKDERTNKKLQSILPATYMRPCANCNSTATKKTVPPRSPSKLPLIQKAASNEISTAIAKNIIQATWEDPARYVDGDINVINADVTVVEIGKAAKVDATFINDGSLLPETPIYPVTVSIKVRRYKNDRVVSSEGEYLYRVAVTKNGNWAAYYVSTIRETPFETTFL